jgi:purine-binding chemotaxis protein CheW
MGRMADARKKARSGAKKAKDVAAPSPPAASAAPAPAESSPEAPAVPEPAADAEPAAASGGRIQLPSSGLASDVLQSMEAQAVSSGPAAESAPAPAERGEPAPVFPPADSGGHSLSFFAAPAQEQRAAAEATEHLATFFLEGEEYGVDVRQVQEIRRLSEITTVPRAPGYIRGVINLRGRILPVLDLKRKLGLGEVEAGRATRIVVVRVGERLLGLLVDGASQVLKVAVSRIEPPPEEVVERGGDYIRGVAKLDDRLIILVDLERLLAHELRAAGAPVTGAPAAEAPDGVS